MGEPVTHYREKYLRGYSIGVGAVVVRDERALLVRRALGRGTGDWAMPSGYVNREETIDVAARRELYEETGISAEIRGLVATRSHAHEGENSAFFVFLMDAGIGQPEPDGWEVDRARFFSLEEVEALQHLQKLSRMVVKKVLAGQAKVLEFHTHPDISPDEYVIYV
jgi:ADP-ribose pyrophosphatase YjhB (NUDIX family)